MSSHSSPPPPVLQRFMIVYEDLATCGGGVDEQSSLEELSEHILYYHDAANNASRETTPSHPSNCNATAVRFAGLCSALRSFPNTLNDDNSTDVSNEVVFSHSKLVFCPLENDDSSIYAVAQVARSDLGNETLTRRRNGDQAWAIRNSIQQWHHRFCLFHGGIQYRLAAKDDATNSHSMIHPEFSQLYKARKQLHRFRTRTDRGRASSGSQDAPPHNTAALDDEQVVAQLEAEIQCLTESLPLKSLRADLTNHYEEYLLDHGRLAAAYHCVVEGVPSPLTFRTIPPPFPPFLPSISALTAVSESLESFVIAHRRPGVRLLGMSSFHQERLFGSHLCAEALCQSLQLEKGLVMEPQIPTTLMQYMAEIRQRQIHHQSTTKHSILHDRFVDHDVPTEGKNHVSVESSTEFPLRGDYFLSPPLSLLSASDEILEVQVPSFGCVWTPRILLPLKCPQTGDQSYLPTRVALYMHGSFSFLLYFVLFQPVALAALADSLTSIASHISSTLCSVYENDGEPTSTAATIGDGQDVILLNRRIHELVVHTSDRHSYKRNTKHNVDPHASKKGKKKHSSKQSSMSTDTALGMDFRHALASHWPPQVIAAFDDVMMEVLAARSRNGDSRVVELCTYLRQGWIYAHTDNSYELYILFCPNKFITVSDVQTAADKTRRLLLLDRNDAAEK